MRRIVLWIRKDTTTEYFRMHFINHIIASYGYKFKLYLNRYIFLLFVRIKMIVKIIVTYIILNIK